MEKRNTALDNMLASTPESMFYSNTWNIMKDKMVDYKNKQYHLEEVDFVLDGLEVLLVGLLWEPGHFDAYV